MTDGMFIDEASLRNLRINAKTFKMYVLHNAVEGLSKFGMRIVAQAQDFLDHGGHRAKGKLIGSGRTIIQPDNTVDAGFYSAYAAFVENGRGPGRMPPVDVIEEWVLRKGRKKNSALKAAAVFSGKSESELAHEAAWAIAKSIAEKGTEPHPFLKPAYDMFRVRIGRFMQDEIDKAVAKFKKK